MNRSASLAAASNAGFIANRRSLFRPDQAANLPHSKADLLRSKATLPCCKVNLPFNQEVSTETNFSQTRIYLIQGDITRVAADAIVNAANSSLMGGGGVDGAIHRAGGPAILAECERIVERMGELPPGEAVATTGGRLPARHVIHTVGPIWYGGQSQEAETLAACYRSSLDLAVEIGADSVAFPAISTGVYGYPFDEACRVAFAAVRDFCAAKPGSISEISFVFFRTPELSAAQEVLEKS